MRPRLFPLTLLALPVFAFAEETPGTPATGRAGQGLVNQINALYAIVDAKDAKAGERATKHFDQEKERHPEEFKKLDTDGDGKISVEEAKAAIATLSASLKEKDPDTFKAVDTNGDGTLSADEVKAAEKEHGKEKKDK